MVARAVKQITPLARVQIKEDTRHDDHTLFKTGLEEVQAVGDGVGETFEIQPEVESRVRNILDDKAHAAETLDDIVAFVLFGAG